MFIMEFHAETFMLEDRFYCSFQRYFIFVTSVTKSRVRDHSRPGPEAALLLVSTKNREYGT